MIDTSLKDTIIEKIQSVAPLYRVMLFGSHARGTADPQSDLDLIVIVDSDKILKNFTERAAHHLTISRALRDIERVMPIDLLVYTKPEFENFIASRSSFSRQVLSEAVILS